ncbi:hypothetical protein K1719_019350 [Acacia pycnantha]|nr:hypothetical protein K1719_019350 [Acacia pycnantha]
MGISQKWLKIVGRKFLGPSNRRYVIIPRTSINTICSNESDKALPGNETSTFEEHGLPVYTEEVAAIKIQACFRGHLARRAYRALRSLVKLQALVRGVFVRRQSRIALHCMHLLVRLQTPKTSAPATIPACANPPKLNVSDISLSTASIPFSAVTSPCSTVSSPLSAALKPSLTISSVASPAFLRFFRNPNRGMSYTMAISSLAVTVVDVVKKNSNYLHPERALIGNGSKGLVVWALQEGGVALHTGGSERVRFKGERVEAMDLSLR